ncbi:MAG: glycosyltransferase [Bacteroidales bacterium]
MNKLQDYPFLINPESIRKHEWSDEILPLVSVRCLTYMHESYIRDTIEGFLLQKTNFRVEIVIHDDASIDSTPEIIKEYESQYPKLFNCIYQRENTNSKSNKKELRKPLRDALIGKYIALCEGDDYWIDPYKLQKQVDFMENHKECSLCFHRAEIKYENSNGKRSYTQDFNGIKFFPPDRLFYEGGSSAPTASLLFHRDLSLEVPEWRRISPVGDMPLKMLLFLKGRIGFINEVMAVRRLGNEGSWNDRVRNDKTKELVYLERMIRMLNEFNKYTEGKYVDDVRKIVMGYDMRSLRLGRKKSVVLCSDDFLELFNSAGFKQRTFISVAKNFSLFFYKSSFLNKAWVKTFCKLN